VCKAVPSQTDALAFHQSCACRCYDTTHVQLPTFLPASTRGCIPAVVRWLQQQTLCSFVTSSCCNADTGNATPACCLAARCWNTTAYNRNQPSSTYMMHHQHDPIARTSSHWQTCPAIRHSCSISMHMVPVLSDVAVIFNIAAGGQWLQEVAWRRPAAAV
jgi:hypothetical protein